MSDTDDPRRDEQPERSAVPQPAPSQGVRKVTVTHLDSPPSSGHQTIHPRRPAPIVPTREEPTGDQPPDVNSGGGEAPRD